MMEYILQLFVDAQMDPLYVHLGVKDAEDWANGGWIEEAT